MITGDIDGPTGHYFQLVKDKIIDGSSANTPKIVLRSNTIRIGCAVITVEAAKHLLFKWREKFEPEDRIILQ